ncbi:MAG TPA: hypothetical protein VER17_04425 [Tepidisphaeraceae bacterium]|nr:hypothetical protein [Tepidisphaeraceae bacterium]
MRKSICAAAALVAAAMLFSAAPAAAQTGPDLLLRPLLSENETWESRGDALIFPEASATGGNDYQMSIYTYQGRFREQRERLIPRIGWDLSYFNLDSEIPLLDQDLVDVSAAVGLELGTYYDWRAGFTVGLGYAGNAPFGESSAWYGKATLLLGRKLDARTQLALVVDYDGNRSIWPDVPLPGFAYIHEFDPALSYTIGIPVSSVTWKPNESFRLDVTWVIVDTFEARAEYKMSPNWTAYGALEQRQEAFSVDDVPGRDRLLFQQRRAEAGVRWTPWEHTSLFVAGGYAFGGEWSTGWDQRESDLVADISDQPYVRFGFERRF